MRDKFEPLHDMIESSYKNGADYADIFIQSSESHSVHFEDGRADKISSSKTNGFGSRIIDGGKTFFAHANGTEIDMAAASFADCAASAGIDLGGARDKCDLQSELIEKTAPLSPPSVDFFKEMDERIRRESGYIRQSSYGYSLSRRRIAVVKPEGCVAYDDRFYTSFAAHVVVEKNGVLETGSERRCMAVGVNDFWNGTTPLDIAETALRRAILMTEAKPCPAGVMNVLMAGEAGGTIVHEACGHGLEADIVEKDYSVYRGRIGEKVADESVTMVDDATLGGLYGSYDCDDEGNAAERTVLIENGILKRYMTDVLSSMLYDMPLTGNGRRESYRCVPVPRMSNTFLLCGKDDFDTMLSRTGNGLYVKKMGGGEVDPTSGDFVFYVTEGYLIKNGKITVPVRGATLTGNGPAALAGISALGKNLVMDPGVCGKSGQSVPVTDGQPSMLIEGLTVGGSAL
ncbi:MAG: TldD/PmbA family protein [Synergistes sp.]|nr:TldD/PmbA family protein [Synergistes sp.]